MIHPHRISPETGFVNRVDQIPKLIFQPYEDENLIKTELWARTDCLCDSGRRQDRHYYSEHTALPASLMPSDSVIWEEIDEDTVRVTLTNDVFEQAFDITIDANGLLEQVQFERWTNANEEKTYRFQSFGGYLSDFALTQLGL